MGAVRAGATKTKTKRGRKKIVVKKKNITGTKLTKTKNTYLTYKNPTKKKTKWVSEKRAKRLGRRYSKKTK